MHKELITWENADIALKEWRIHRNSCDKCIEGDEEPFIGAILLICFEGWKILTKP